MYEYVKGNRLPVPSEVQSTHFLYVAQSATVSKEDAEILCSAVDTYLREHGLNPAQIESVGRSTLLSMQLPDAVAAFDRAVEVLGFKGLAPTLLCCFWAAPHVDSSFEGTSFVSHVLSTGPEPYVLQTLDIQHFKDQAPTIQASTRVLNPGMTFVMDATTPHMAAPANPGADQLLVLLQAELTDTNEAERRTILDTFPPLENDLDQREVFNGYIC